MYDGRGSQIPKEYTPLSPWAYFGYSLLFVLPVAGLILLIVFSFSSANINRRNFARSYFCIYMLILIVVAVCLLLRVSIPFLFW